MRTPFTKVPFKPKSWICQCPSQYETRACKREACSSRKTMVLSRLRPIDTGSSGDNSTSPGAPSPSSTTNRACKVFSMEAMLPPWSFANYPLPYSVSPIAVEQAKAARRFMVAFEPGMRASFVTHLESALNGARLERGKVWSLHQGRPIWVRYDLAAIREAIWPADFPSRPPTFWRYRELLTFPRDTEPASLGEGMSPLLECPRLGRRLGLSNLIIKDESQLPTRSFKSRGMAVAVSMARQLGLKRLAVPTAGNAGGAMAAYAAKAGLDAFVFMPDDTPIINQLEAHLFGAKAFLVNGLITDCGRIVRDGAERMGWFDMSTLREPYRIEGKKTMGL